MQLGKNRAAKIALDSLEKSLSRLKKHKAVHLSTLAQNKIAAKKYRPAITYLEAALKEGAEPFQEIRWNYILGQLYEAEKNALQALAYYRKVERRNSAYELAFQATLNIKKLNTLIASTPTNLQRQLQAMLNADKNEDFKDQIYHQLALNAAADSNYNAAIKYEQQALETKGSNKQQRILSYLNLSALEYNHFKNYRQAAFYHDSALVNLPENYHDYNNLHRQNEQLHFLAEQHARIDAEEKLLDSISAIKNLNHPALAVSSNQLFKHYTNLADFYTYELKDEKEASSINDILKTKFPTAMLAANQQLMADKYNAGNRATQLLTYHRVYGAFENKNYQQVIDTVNRLLANKAPQPFQAQLAYLRALSTGSLYPIDSLISTFKNDSLIFERDSLIGPLVKHHLADIKKNLLELKKRKVAILPADSVVGLQQDLAETPLKALPLSAENIEYSSVAQGNEVEKPDSIFSNVPSSTYYFVVAVSDASTNLNSSRFGIGQFNRGNYANQELKHRILEFDDHQLIYVGNFSNFEDTKKYAASIIPLLQKIMKVSSDRYSSFVISKENLEKIDQTDRLNKYLVYYKNNFENE